MKRAIPIAPMASCFALCAFAIAIVSGLTTSNGMSEVIGDALLAMVLCYILAIIVAKSVGVIVREHLREYAQKQPVPGYPPAPLESGADIEEEEGA